ncbi:hypothetical protein RIF29_12453 [Crotalaria pallida]|uniref:Ribosomal protein L1 n=1 Tax=Crotalaria pallida TaxID=3830 RepID=A0AAN9INB2_CROPI
MYCDVQSHCIIAYLECVATGDALDALQLAIAEFKQGKVEYRADKTGIVHLPFGKANFAEEDLLVNLVAAIRSVEANKPSGAEGVYWKSAQICSAMGPSIRLNIREMLDYRLPSE